MNILLLNPNISVEMTRRIAEEAGRYCEEGNTLISATAVSGPAVIASRVSFAVGAYAALETWARCGGAHDAIILACFGDPGLEALRELARVPVVGLLESSVARAMESARPFSIVTAGRAWVPMLEERVRMMGDFPAFRGVYPIDTTGLDIANDPQRFTEMIQTAVDRAAGSGAQTVILGGSALAGFGRVLSSAKVQLVDPLEAAMRCVQRKVPPLPVLDDASAPPIAYHGLSPALMARLRWDRA